MKQKLGCLVTVLVVFFAPLVLVFSIIPLKFDGTWRATEDPADYGIIRDNCDNAYPEEFLMGFFPKKLEPYFENVVYEYKAFDWCDYNCEMYLEFTISDPEQFQLYTAELTTGLTGQEFPYDAKYTDYVIANVLYVEPTDAWSTPEDPNYFLRNGARMGRILICEEEQRIICTGMVVSTCCGGFSDDYDFYERFGIDPQEYSDRFCDPDAY